MRALLEAHLAFTRAASPPEDVHALDAEGLLDPAVSFFSLRVDGEVLAVGALKRLSASHAEIKSMHTAAPARGRGLARAMLTHLLSEARAASYQRVGLETGTMQEFAAARALYASAGFVACEPFGSYSASPNSCFLTLVLDEAVDNQIP